MPNFLVSLLNTVQARIYPAKAQKSKAHNTNTYMFVELETDLSVSQPTIGSGNDVACTLDRRRYLRRYICLYLHRYICLYQHR